MTLVAWYSRTAALLGCGTAIYAREDGTEVEVSLVERDDGWPTRFSWSDRENRGLVVRYVRPGQRSQMQHWGPHDSRASLVRKAKANIRHLEGIQLLMELGGLGAGLLPELLNEDPNPPALGGDGSGGESKSR